MEKKQKSSKYLEITVYCLNPGIVDIYYEDKSVHLLRQLPIRSRNKRIRNVIGWLKRKQRFYNNRKIWEVLYYRNLTVDRESFSKYLNEVTHERKD